MKIAVSANSDDLNQMVSPVFGRCKGFIIIEENEEKIEGHSFIENTAASAVGGAGIAAAQIVLGERVNAVISGNLGPNAFMVLQQAGVKVYQAFDLSVGEAVNQLIEGKLKELTSSSVEGHFGSGRGRRGRGAL